MPPATAAYYDEALADIVNGTEDLTCPVNLADSVFKSLKLKVCQPITAPLLRGNKDNRHGHSLDKQTFPLLIFSPGGGASRLLYSAIAQSVASSGYTVITVDHPYDAGIVEFPDGSLIHGLNLTTQPQFDLTTAVRASDARFVIDYFAADSPDAQEFPLSGRPSQHPMNRRNGKVGMLGHSLGGTTVAATMMKDSRILAGINLDGLLKHLPPGNISKPLFLFANAFRNQSTDATWAEMWPNLHGVRMQYTVTTGRHATFTDLPLLAELTGFRKRLPEWLIDELFGKIEGGRALELVWKWTTGYFDWLLKSDTQPDETGRDFAEVVFENGTDAFGSRKQPNLKVANPAHG